MGDEFGIAQESKQLFRTSGEQLFIGQKHVGQPMHILGGLGHWPFGIIVAMKGLAGFDPVDHFDTADFDHPVTILRIKAGGFGVENYFPHKYDIGLKTGLRKRCFQFLNKFLHLPTRFCVRQGCVDDGIGLLSFVRVRHLQGFYLLEPLRCHAGARQNPILLVVGVGRYHDNMIDALGTAFFEKQRDVEQDQWLVVMFFEKGLTHVDYRGVDQAFEPLQGSRITQHQCSQLLPIHPVAVGTAWKQSFYFFHKSAARSLQLMHRGIGIE